MSFLHKYNVDTREGLIYSIKVVMWIISIYLVSYGSWWLIDQYISPSIDYIAVISEFMLTILTHRITHIVIGVIALILALVMFIGTTKLHLLSIEIGYKKVKVGLWPFNIEEKGNPILTISNNTLFVYADGDLETKLPNLTSILDNEQMQQLEKAIIRYGYSGKTSEGDREIETTNQNLLSSGKNLRIGGELISFVAWKDIFGADEQIPLPHRFFLQLQAEPSKSDGGRYEEMWHNFEKDLHSPYRNEVTNKVITGKPYNNMIIELKTNPKLYLRIGGAQMIQTYGDRMIEYGDVKILNIEKLGLVSDNGSINIDPIKGIFLQFYQSPNSISDIKIHFIIDENITDKRP